MMHQEEPLIHSVETFHSDYETLVIVVHRYRNGVVRVVHTPLDSGKFVSCSICEGGARVYVT